MRAILIPADQGYLIRPVQITDRGDSCLRDLQALVGGDIETLPYPGRDDVAPFIHGEGKFVPLPRNDRATVLLRASMFPDDYIAGDCVLTGFDAESGDTVDLPGDITVLTVYADITR